MNSNTLRVSALLLSLSAMLSAAEAGPFSVSNYQLIRQTAITRTVYEFEYKASVTNNGTLPATSVTGTVVSASPQLTLVTKSLNWGSVAAGATVVSQNTFVYRFDRTATFDVAMLQWTVTGMGPRAPTAIPGPNQVLSLGTLAQLDGSASTDPQGSPLTYLWSIQQLPQVCGATLTNATSATTSLTGSCVGTIVVGLVVTNGYGLSSSLATVSVSTDPVPPTANAGPNQTIGLNQPNMSIFLNGSLSNSPGGLPLTYLWIFSQKPNGSTAALSNPTSVSPTFVADKIGTYVLTLTVDNGFFTSPPSQVTITTSNVRPVAAAGPSQSKPVGSFIQLSGAASTDANGLTLTYSWSFLSVPSGSAATLSNPTVPNPSFTMDLAGTYIVQLIVNNGYQDSLPSTVTISTQILPPVAEAGPGQLVNVGDTVTLDGTASSDPNGLPLTYLWSFNFKPAGSAATLSSVSAAKPSFVADRAGNYVLQLIVNNGTQSSAPDTAQISTLNVAPVAVAGPTQNVLVGTTVQLDGRASKSNSGYPLSYSWSFNSKPQGSAAALTGGTTSQPSFVADVEGVYLIQLIVNDTLQDSAPDTVQVNAANGDVITISGPANLFTYDVASATVQLSNPAVAGGQVVNLTVDLPASLTVPASVTVPEGSTGANFAITGGPTPGFVTITGTAAGFTSGSRPLQVDLRGMQVSFAFSLVGVGKKATGTVTLAKAAPSGGLTVNLVASGNISVDTPNVTLAAGEFTSSFTVTGITPGGGSINANAPGYTPASASITTTAAVVNLPTTLTLGAGSSVPYPVSLGVIAPNGGVTISFSSSDANLATVVPPTVTIPAGATTPSVQPQLTALAAGSVTITGSAPNYLSGTGQVVVQSVLSFSPTSATVLTSNKKDVTLNLSAPAPVGGLVVTLTSSDTSMVTVPPTVTIPGGTTQTQVTLTGGLTTGTPTVTATAAAVTSGTLQVQVTPAPLITVQSTPITIGRNLQAPIRLYLEQPAPAGNLQVTLSTANPNLLFSATRTGAGASSLTLTVAAGGTASSDVYVQNAGASSGGATYTVSAPGYQTATAQTEFAPSGFAFLSNTASTNTLNGPDPQSVYAVYLNAGSYVGSQDLRGGVTETLALSSSNKSVGTLPATISFAGGANYAAVDFTPVGAGTTDLTVTQPSGYTTPADHSKLTYTVTAPGFSVYSSCPSCVTNIGRNLQAAWQLALGAPAPAGDLTVTISTNSPNMALSAVGTTAGSSSLSFVIPAGQSNTPVFYVQNVAVSSGSGVFTVAAQHYQSTNFPITFTQSGFSFVANVASTSTLSGPQPLTVSAVSLNGGNYETALQLRGGLTETLTLNSSNHSAGILPATVVFTGGAYGAAVDFTPVGAGVTDLTVTQPSGYTPVANYPKLTYTVSAPGFYNYYSCPGCYATIGRNLQSGWQLQLEAPVPVGNLTVTVSTLNPNLALSLVRTSQGSSSITFNLPAGAYFTPVFYVQNLGATSGSTTFAVSAPQYQTTNFNITFADSGFSFLNNNATTTTLSGAQPLSVYSVTIEGGNYTAGMDLRGGLTETLNLASSNPSVGTLASTLTFDGGNAYFFSDFTPISLGTTELTITQPPGYITPNNYPKTVYVVTAPAFQPVQGETTIGRNLQSPWQLVMGAPAPVGNLTVTISTASPNLLLSASPTTAGASSITLTVAEGQYYTPAFYVHNAGISTGTAIFSVAAPSFQTTNFTINLVPSAFVFQADTQSGTLSNGSMDLLLFPAALDPQFLTVSAIQPVRGGVDVTIPLGNSNASVATVPASVTITGGSSYGLFTTALHNVGTTVITPAQPAGYSSPSNFSALTFTVQ